MGYDGEAFSVGVSTACARTLVDEFARAGLTDAVVAPGSRSAPLALALADDERIRLHVHLDERSGAFFALGVAKASGRPTLVLCTSGTAAAHFHPAVLEAEHSRVPLIVCTADRPAELRDTGAPQTTDQIHLYGSAVRFFADLPADGDPAARSAWRPIAARVWAEAAGPPAGPVHLNVAFREPLVPVGPEEAIAAAGMEPGRADGRPWVLSHRAGPAALPAQEAAQSSARILAVERGLVVAGWGSPAGAEEVAAFLRWPILADGISGLRRGAGGAAGGRSAVPLVTTYEALLRVPAFAAAHRPDLVIRFGGPLTSKTAMGWLDASIPQILVDPEGGWLDPQRTAAERVPALPDLGAAAVLEREPLPAVTDWCDTWLAAERTARQALDTFLDGDDEPFEGRVARDVAATCATSALDPALVVASSMPVRDLEAFAGQVPGRVFANRGVNGIDGLVSTVLGIAAGRRVGSAEPGGRPVVGLLGDLAFLHDAGGLLGAPGRGLDAVFVVVDNGGGGIFSFLPQAALPSERFELLFGTPPEADVVAVAQAYGVPAERVGRAAEVGPAVERGLDAKGARVIVVPTGDRTANVDRHRQAWAAVTEAVAKAF
ncbi:MAG TPA: 2-succinyl-5-enolpyruvyl-6-hydroxy-3-cyclohexene-1-carboxylic-acid synthase [Acidimicrobiia bacterium]|nr:2-succinyl-5-enolpyruvyl-6-hydroxy-3-cyclohexene-1-carboxylic-acid synthase [Acidimicrobiia bacterium]